MATTQDPQVPEEPKATSDAAAALPDYLVSPDAVAQDASAKWRYGRAPDYTKTRKVFAESKRMNHTAGSLPQLVENLVKNWEVEASFKPVLADWRTVDHANYTFSINGGPPQSAEHMLNVGTYNAIIAPNEYYSPRHSDFASSHKTFKRMMPTFAWEVLEVYSGPPTVAFRWRHWGVMQNDYVGFNDKGEKITAKAHGGAIDIEGVTVANVDDKVRLQAVHTWFDPLEMFRQIAPKGIVNKEVVPHRVNEGVEADAHKPSQAPQANETSEAPVVAPSTVEAAGDAVSAAPVNEAEKGVVEQNGHARTESTADATPLMERANSPEKEIEASGGDQVPVEEFHDAPTNQVAATVFDAETATGNTMEPQTAATSTESQPLATETQPPATASDSQITATDSQAPAAASDSQVPMTTPSLLQTSSTPTNDTTSKPYDAPDEVTEHLSQPGSVVHPHPHSMEDAVQPAPGEGVAAEAGSEEVRLTHEEMSRMAVGECPFLMNRE
ncbi:hypothetical protein K402DRAFT_322458 [Aulographum hederae CBS 113979]|uniref:Pathogen-related protein n=1 Tax=Aulographum hederae CBS 113979 TaxID=1176131 RepID=A0A6G1HEU8_9PEZI|nr:hypothetical protein K402DRAFT_322458 [Aulographum hederae CBS 113979]